MTMLTVIRVELIAVVSLWLVCVPGCTEPPSELDLRRVADAYILVINEIYEKDGSLPMSIDKINQVMTPESRKRSNPAGYSIRYWLVLMSNGETTFRLVVGDIMKDRRELHFDSKDATWFYDS